jgi:hypothetical protein
MGFRVETNVHVARGTDEPSSSSSLHAVEYKSRHRTDDGSTRERHSSDSGPPRRAHVKPNTLESTHTHQGVGPHENMHGVILEETSQDVGFHDLSSPHRHMSAVRRDDHDMRAIQVTAKSIAVPQSRNPQAHAGLSVKGIEVCYLVCWCMHAYVCMHACMYV